MKASLPSASAVHEEFDENAGYPGPTPQDELAADLEQHIKETLVKEPAAPTLAGSGETSPELKIHHDEPAIDPTLAERIRIPFIDPVVKGFVFVRLTTTESISPTYEAVVFFNGNCVASTINHSDRREAITEVMSDLYRMTSRPQAFRDIARQLNTIIHNIKTGDPHGPAGEPCEWPIASDDDEQASDEPPTDDTTTDSDIDEAGDVICAGDVDDGSAINSELTPPEGPAAVEIVALCDKQAQLTPADESTINRLEINILEPAVPAEACGEVGVVGFGEAVAAMSEEFTVSMATRRDAERLYEQSLSTAKDWYVRASQHRADLQSAVKSAKSEEAERLETINTIEARGWQAFMPAKKSAPTTAAPASDSTSTTPAFPSPDTTLPPPEAPFSPQAGVSGANDHPAPPAGAVGDWQSIDIAALNLKKSLATRLREAGHDTIGKLEKLRGQFEGLLSIDGVGRAKADEIEEALLGWLSRNRDAAVLSAAKEKAVAGEGLALEMAAQGQD